MPSKEIVSILEGPTRLPSGARELGFYTIPFLFVPDCQTASELHFVEQLGEFTQAVRHHAVRIVWKIYPYYYPPCLSERLIKRAESCGLFHAGLLQLCMWLHPFAKAGGLPYEGPLEWLDEILFLSAHLSIKPVRDLKGRMIGGKERFEGLHQSIRAKLRGVEVVTSDPLTEVAPLPVNPYRDVAFLQENFKGELQFIRQYVQPQADLFDLAIALKPSSGQISDAWDFFLSAYSKSTRHLAHSKEIGKAARQGSEYYRSTGRGRGLVKL